MIELYWAVVVGIGILHSLCWLQLNGKVRREKKWFLHSPLWPFFSDAFTDKDAVKICKMGRITLVLPIVLVALFFGARIFVETK